LVSADTVTFSAGGTAYTSTKYSTGNHYNSSTGKYQYRVKLSSVAFVGMPTNVFPGTTYDVRTRTSHNKVKAGDVGSFSSVGTTYKTINYYVGYGAPDQPYVLANNSSANMGCTAGVTWEA